MRIQVKKWGNSAALRLPSSIVRAARIELDQALDIREEDGRIIIEPVREGAYDIERLIADITADNQHREADFGNAVGQEVW